MKEKGGGVWRNILKNQENSMMLRVKVKSKSKHSLLQGNASPRLRSMAQFFSVF